MNPIFASLNEYCGFNEGVFVREMAGTLQNDTGVIRLCMDNTITSIALKNVEPNSKVAFKVNGWVHTESVANSEGEVVLHLNNPANLSRIHCPQVFLNSKKDAEISYAIN
jgi:hypothetical protein